MQATSRLGHLFLTEPTHLQIMLWGETYDTEARSFELVHRSFTI